jgi:hypothetical protein
MIWRIEMTETIETKVDAYQKHYLAAFEIEIEGTYISSDGYAAYFAYIKAKNEAKALEAE